MGMTLTQKILAAHAGLPEVKAGQLINAKLDIVLGNDITTPVAINEFERAGFNSVFDKQHIAIVLDHFVPNKDIKSATGMEFHLENYSEHSLDEGSTSRAASYVGLTWGDGTVTWGAGTDTDIIVAGVKALVSAINNK